MGRRSPRRAYDHGLVLWDTATWAIRHKVSRARIASAPRRWRSPRDGRHLAVSLGFAARMIDVATGNEVRRFPKQPVGMNAVAVSPDGDTLATTGLMIKLWDVATGQEKTPKPGGPRRLRRVGRVQPRRDDAWPRAAADHTVKLWDLATRRERMTLEGHANSVQSVAFSPDGKSLASIGFTPELILWDARFRQAPPHLESGAATWARKSASARTAAGSPPRHSRVSDGRHVGIWDVATGKQGRGSRLRRRLVHVHARRQEADFRGRVGLVATKAPAARLGHRAREGGANDRRRALAIADAASPP